MGSPEQEEATAWAAWWQHRAIDSPHPSTKYDDSALESAVSWSAQTARRLRAIYFCGPRLRITTGSRPHSPSAATKARTLVAFTLGSARVFVCCGGGWAYGQKSPDDMASDPAINGLTWIPLPAMPRCAAILRITTQEPRPSQLHQSREIVAFKDAASGKRPCCTTYGTGSRKRLHSMGPLSFRATLEGHRV